MRTKRTTHIVQYRLADGQSITTGAFVAQTGGLPPVPAPATTVSGAVNTTIEQKQVMSNLWQDLDGSECFDLHQAQKKANDWADKCPGTVCRVARIWPSIVCKEVVTRKIVSVADTPRLSAQSAEKKPKAKAKKPAASTPPAPPPPAVKAPEPLTTVKIKDPPSPVKPPEPPKATAPPTPPTPPPAAKAPEPAKPVASPALVSPPAAAPKTADGKSSDFDELFSKSKAAKKDSPPDGELF